MKITKVEPIYPTQLSTIPRDHWKWCGHTPKKKEPEISNGDLILYNKYGKIVIHKSAQKENENG
tara:strand:+ start:297 stop:488 length:192 start_codon:yes stop_codon:yes gene_type:complete